MSIPKEWVEGVINETPINFLFIYGLKSLVSCLQGTHEQVCIDTFNLKKWFQNMFAIGTLQQIQSFVNEKEALRKIKNLSRKAFSKKR